MNYLTASTFTIGAIVFMFASTASAKPISRAAMKTVGVSHSSKSLQSVSGRSIADYPGIYQAPATVNHTRAKSVNQAQHPQSANRFNDRLIIDAGDSFGSASIPEPLRINQSDSEYNSQFSVQYKLNR